MSSAPTRRLSPAEFAFFVLGLDPYGWQVEAAEAVASGRPTALVAANGSGKTAMVNVVLLLWFLYTYPRGIAMVTSGSWLQLETQLWPNLELHRTRFPGWKWLADRIETPEGGFVQAYSVREPGRAEGHHQNLAAERPLFLLIDEAKSVPEVIYQALSRCTPTYTLLTSSPGAPMGTFYHAFRRNSRLYHRIQVSAYDCPHIPASRIEMAQALYGPEYERHPIYRSMILGEFTEGDDSTIISRGLLERALRSRPEFRDGVVYGGSDWAAGGDETTAAERRGNRIRLIFANRERDTMRSAELVVGQFRQRGIRQGHAWGDAHGLGLPIIQAAKRFYGYRISEFYGGIRGDDPDHYADLNIEAWMSFRQALERGELLFDEGLDETSISQLTDRFLTWDNKGRLRCESKDDMRERGLSSPDRADALVMACWAGRHMSYRREDGTFPPRYAAPRSVSPVPHIRPTAI